MTSSRSTPLSEALIGSWEMTFRTDVAADGSVRVDPALGPDPVGLLIYDRTGHFAAQFMKRDRTSNAEPATDGCAGAQHNTRARGGYDAYFGTYRVDDAAGVVTQRLTAALSPENVGHEVTRAMTVRGDELSLTLQTNAVDGTPVERRLTWRRVG